MTDWPTISVVIPTFNRCTRVCQALRSVLAGARTPAEVIVVDDGSTDATAAALSDVASPGVVVIRSETNTGVAAARNRGIAAAQGEWIALLDSDDRWLPSHLSQLAAYLASHPECRVTQSLERWYREGRRVNMRPVHQPVGGDIFERSVRRCLVSSSTVLFERSLFEAVDGYDERLPACEDYDLWLRMALVERFGLLEVETVVKDGGRPDQLSRRIWGLDRFRVFSLTKVLCGGLTGPRAAVVQRAALKKLAVLEQGASRRNRFQDVQAYRRWAAALAQVYPERRETGSDLPAILASADTPPGARPPDPILDALRPYAQLDSRHLCQYELSA